MILLGQKYYLKNINIAIPVILSFAGQALVQVADSVMTGRLGATQLAAVSLAGTIVMNVLVFGIGLSLGLTPISGNFWARNNFKSVAIYFQNSLIVNFIASLILTLLLFLLLPFLYIIGQPKEVLDITGTYYSLIALSIIPFMVFLAFKQFMEGTGNTKTSMNITLLAIAINIVLNYLLIFGKFGFPKMGIDGAGLATLISRLLMPIAFWFAMSRNYLYKKYFHFFRKAHFSIQKQVELIKIGLPISGQMSLEFFSLSMITIMMGWMGTKSLAANQIVQTMISLTFMITNGIAAASTILVSHAYGNKNIADVKKHGLAGLHISLVIMSIAGLVFLFLGEQIASLFTTSAEVIKIAGNIFIVVAIFELFDGLQVTALGALRGIMDVNRAMVYAAISYIGVSIPFAYVAGFVFKWGEMGLMSGFAVGLLTASILFITRFKRKTSDFHSLFINLGHEKKENPQAHI